jgi:hypothetical protein
MRAQYWQFDQAARPANASPPANGFGRVSSPPFGEVDISTTIPTDTFSAASDLNAYTIDLEATKSVDFCSWWLEVSAGLRFASIDQSYFAQQRTGAGVLGGQIDFRHELQGIGPTVSLLATRPLGYCWTLFGQARGSLVFGDGSSQLVTGEDLDLANPFRTTISTRRDDLLPIAEVRCGLGCQLWEGAGNASSEEGNLGFFGFGVALGVTR